MTVLKHLIVYVSYIHKSHTTILAMVDVSNRFLYALLKKQDVLLHNQINQCISLVDMRSRVLPQMPLMHDREF